MERLANVTKKAWKSLLPVTALALAFVASTAGPARAQCSSLLGSPDKRRPLTMADASWTYQAPSDVKTWKLNDFVTVLLEEKTQFVREGQVDQRKQAQGALTLKDWILLNGFQMSPDPQTAGDPKVAGTIDNYYRAQANLQNKDSFETSIQCAIVDIRPNGTLVVEGRAAAKFDEEEWELSVSGIVRPEDIMPNNTVKSEKMAEKRIRRLSSGHGRDGIRRGWLLKTVDTLNPF